MIIEIIKNRLCYKEKPSTFLIFEFYISSSVLLKLDTYMLILEIFQSYFNNQSETEIMKSDFQPRPESKNRNTKVRPVSRYANIELAQECFKNGKELQSKEAYDKAIEQYLRALMYDPNYFQAYCNMGSCYRAQGRYLQSKSMYLKSISIKSDDAISRYNLANVQRIIGNYENSINHYEFVIKLGDSGNQSLGSLLVNSLVNLGICYKMTEQYEKSIECFEKAKRLDSKDESIIFNQAMTYMAILQNLNIDVFHEVSKEKAEKAKTLFQQLLKNNPNHEMANIKLCRVSSILDKSNANLNQNVAKLKSMLSNQKSTLKDEINSELGYILKLLKQYEQSATHYNQSFNKKQQKKSSKVIETNVYDSAQGYLNTNIVVLSEQQAIKKIKQGEIDEVKKSLQSMQESNISKHVIQLAIQLELTQIESQDHFKKALQIYNKYFTQNKVELPFQKISIQAHKLIGKILGKQNKFKESIKHFEYISSKLKSNQERSAVHTSLGSDYEALGDKQKALEQYQLALEQEPDNYQLIYNVGCCLYDRGQREESNKYFQKFLDLIKKDTKIQLTTKNIYIADCLVTMASSTTNSSQQFQRYENAWKAIKQIEQGESSDEIQFDNEKMLNFYLRWADLLEQKMINISDKKSEVYMSTKQKLLEVYMCLLSTQGCPDRDAILNNCAILYYEERLYVNALANLNQISVHMPFSLNSLALTYLHLGEHIMATKTIYAASQLDENDSIIKFNKQLIEWVYGIAKTGRLYTLYNNQSDSLIFIRWQYAILVIDSLSKRLKYEKGDLIDSQINEIIQHIFQKDNLQLNLDEIQKRKLQFLVAKLQSANEPSNRSRSNIDDLINFCITPTHNVEQDLKNLIEKLNKNKQMNETIPQVLLNIFIFTNKDKGHSIRTYLQKKYHKKQETYSLQMDRRVTITEDLIKKQFSFSNTSDIIENFCSWQCQIEDKIIVLMHHIEKNYYNHNVRNPLEVEYHFPRHNQLQECSITINRIISLIYNIFNIKTNIKIKEKTISGMKYELIDEIQADFQIQMRKQSFVTIQLGQKLRILTLHANFNSRQQCGKFIKQLQKQCSVKNEIDLRKHEQEVVLLISGIVAISCTWSEKDQFKNTIKALLNSPLELYHQAILQIQENLYFIQDPNEVLWEKLSKIEAFRSK